MKKITQFKRENNVKTPKDPTLRNSARKRQKQLHNIRKSKTLMRFRVIKSLIKRGKKDLMLATKKLKQLFNNKKNDTTNRKKHM